jgi:PAS domain S-box-containing protein
MSHSVKVLIVDDEELIRLNLRALLEDLGYNVTEAVNGRDGLDAFDRERPDLVLTDLRMPEMDGLTLIAELRDKNIETPIIVISGTGTIQDAIAAVRLGAWDYMVKPVEDAQGCEIIIKRALERARLMTENRRYREHLEELVQEKTIDLLASEARYKRLLESVTSYVYTVTIKNGLPDSTVHGAGCEGVTGFTPEEYVADPKLWYRIVHEDDRHLVLDMSRRIFDETTPITFEHRISHKDTSTRWVEDTLVPHRNDRGDLLSYDGIISDITEHKQAEDKLKTNEARFRGYFELPIIGIAMTTLEKGWIDVNDRLCTILGYPREELMHMTWAELTHPDDLATDVGQFNRVLAGEIDGYSMEKRFIHRDGEPIWTSLSVRCVRFSGDEPDYFVVLVQDITERIRAEIELRKSEEKFSSIFRLSPEIITISRGSDGTFLDVNDAFVMQLGYSKEEAIEHSSLELGFWADPEDRNRMIRKFQEQHERLHQFEVNLRRRDQSIITVLLSAAYIEIKGEKFLMLIATDITDRKQAEEEKKKLEMQLIQAQKMEAIGTLAGGIAHDFNNILSSVIGFAGLAQMKLEAGKSLGNELNEVLEAGARAKDLVKQILTFSRKTEIQKIPMELVPLIKETSKFIRASLPSTIEIKQDLNVAGSMIMADPTQVHQVLMNLCTNAAHAMKERGGILDIRLKEVDLDDEVSRQFKGLEAGRYLRLSISDNGCGIPKEIISKIFDPFFTTKERGEGTGMGLSVVHGIVVAMGGDITVYSDPGIGTTFNVLLPTYKGEKGASDFPWLVLRKGSGRILYVDDEAGIVASGCGILEELGYEVVSTTRPLEALEIFRSKPDAFDLVLTDLTMPKMTGLELSRRLQEIRPDIPIVLCTGFSSGLAEEKVKDIGISGIVMKPMLPRELAEVIYTVLNPDSL